MSVKKAAEKAEQVKNTGQKKKTTKMVYCGPAARGIARQYTVFAGELPETLIAAQEKIPALKTLTVPIERFAETRKKVEQRDTAENILFRKAAAALKKYLSN